MAPQLRREDYTVGWVCALPDELAAAQEMLDEKHDTPEYDAHDTNLYTCGRVGEHNVVIACLPKGQTGTNSAAAVAVQMKSTFLSTRFGLMVGIGGGVPSEEADVRLGDVVVSVPHKLHGGVVQYDSGKATPSGFERTGALCTPPTVLLNAVAILHAKYKRKRDRPLEYLCKLDSLPEFSREAAGLDILFEAEYNHVGSATCAQCKTEHTVTRAVRSQDVVVHYGTIASGNQVMRSAAERDKVSAELGGVLCFEMEAAGLMNSFPCLVVRGISDYADSHKNKQWQAYAAGTAAAYAKEVLSVIPSLLKSSTGSSNPMNSQLPTAKISEEGRRQLVASLDFPQMGQRFQSIRGPHSGTCKWLLTNGHYLAWLDDQQFAQHHGLLWLKGKPGSGKSTMMKFALTNARLHMQQDVHISFFFNARGSDIEKSTKGMYRQLLFQLLMDLPKTQQAFDDFHMIELPRAPDYQWEINILQDVFAAAIGKLGQSRLWIYIDALDECDEDQVRDMVTFLTSHLETSGIGMRVFFASRPYPNINVRNKLEINLDAEEEHIHDITSYVQKEFVSRNASQSQNLQQIQEKIVERASGVFIWVVLVVQMLNKEYDRGCSIPELENMVHYMHKDLGQLFQKILDQGDGDVESTRLCLLWLLFSTRPLSREELYFAIRSASDQDIVTLGRINTETMDAFILNSSKGLAELTVNATVQFIHETVRDFLFKDGAEYIQGNASALFVGHGHDRLTQCCVNCISSLDRTLSNEFTTTGLKASETSPMTVSSFETWNREDSSKLALRLKSPMPQFSFIGYALSEVFNHADASEAGGVSQDLFLQNFNVRKWISLDNFWEDLKYQDLQSSCVDSSHGSDDDESDDDESDRYESDNDDADPSLLYIVTKKRLLSLLGTVLRLGLYTDIDSGLRTSPLRVMLNRCEDNALRTLLTPSHEDDSEAEIPSGLELDGILYDYHHRPPGLEHASVVEIIGTIGGEPALIALLRSRRCRYPTRLKSSPLAFAAECGYEELLKLLLGREDLEPNSEDDSGFTPLARAAQAGRARFVELLLGHKAVDINAQCSRQREALSQGSKGRTALSYAVSEGHEKVVQLLLRPGSNADLPDDKGVTPLMYAALSGHKCILKRLLAHQDLQISAQSKSGFTALAYAVFNGHEDIVEQLLREAEIDVNLSGYVHRRTPLMLALKGKHWHIAKMILRNAHVDIDVCDKYNRSASDYLLEEGALASQFALALAYREDGQVKKAVKLLEAISEVVYKLLPPEHLSLVKSQQELAMAYQADKQVLKAIKLLEEIKNRIMLANHPSLPALEEALADMYEELDADSASVSVEELSDSSLE